MSYGRTYAPRTHVPAAPKPPAQNPWRGVLASRYALWNARTERWVFFQVDQPTDGKWAGYTFLNELSGGNRIPVRDPAKRDAIMRAIARNPLGAAKDYGKKETVCGVCHTQLTDPESIAAGIGPVCIKKF